MTRMTKDEQKEIEKFLRDYTRGSDDAVELVDSARRLARRAEINGYSPHVAEWALHWQLGIRD